MVHNIEGVSRQISCKKKLKAVYFTHREADVEILQRQTDSFLEVAHAKSGGFFEACGAGCMPDAVFIDVDIPGTYFPDNIRWIRSCSAEMPIFVLTRETDFFFQALPYEFPPDCVFPFPPETDHIKERIENISSSNRFYPDGISPSAVRLRKEISMAAAVDYPVLLLGETGCGKERVANAIHFHSARKHGPFRAQNISAIPSTLIDSVLFGAVKGSYTGASGSSGLFEQSRGGTLFLDEIGEMDIELQPKILRALEEGEIYRIGGSNAIKTDFRLICATNRDLKSRVLENKFRSDLYYRLDIIRVEIPPLRDRTEDIPSLVRDIMHKNGKTLSLSALDKMAEYSWPGNIRQLLNCVTRAAVRAKGSAITADDIVF